MADDPRVTAIIDAENRARQVLLSAAQDVARYQAVANSASANIAGQTTRLQRTTETAYRVIQRRTSEATEVIREQVQTVREELIPAYNNVSDAAYHMVEAEGAAAGQADALNQALLDRVNIFEKAANASLGGKVTQVGVTEATGSEGGGNVAGSIVTGAIAADRAVVAHRAYAGAVAEGATAQVAMKSAVTATVAPLANVAKGVGVVGRFVAGLSIILGKTTAGFFAARAAGSGMFMSLIAGVRAFTVALLASPIGPYVVAILALVAAVKAAVAIFKLWSPEINKKAAAEEAARIKTIAYNKAIQEGLSAQQAEIYATEEAARAKEEYMKKAGAMSALGSIAKKAFAPWIEWWKTFKEKFLVELAPTIAVISVIFMALGATIQFVANKIILPVVKFLGDTLINVMKVFNIVLLAVIDALIGVLQPAIEGIYAFINAVRIAFAIFTSKEHSPAEKVKLFGKLVIAYFMESAKSGIRIIEGLVNGIIKLFFLAVKLVAVPLGALSDLCIDVFSFIGKTAVNIIRYMIVGLIDLIESGVNGLIGGINKLIEKINEVPGISIDKIGNVDFSGLTDPINNFFNGINSYLDRIADGQQVVDAVLKGLEAAEKFATEGVTMGADKLAELIQKVQDEFGLSLEDIAAEVGVDLLNAPDLAAAFKKILEKTKLKLEGLNELNDKLGAVNAKDMRIEINPVIQLFISEDVDADRARAIIFPLIDEALQEAAAKQGQTAAAASVGNV